MPNGSLSLSEFPLPMIELACDKCGRRGRLLKSKLIEAYRPDVALPDLRTMIAICDRAASMSDPCGAYFVALVPRASDEFNVNAASGMVLTFLDHHSHVVAKSDQHIKQLTQGESGNLSTNHL